MPLVFDGTTGYPPPGRTRLTYNEAEDELVNHERFTSSTTRGSLWGGLSRYMARFFELERRHAESLEGERLVHCVWLGGSFVSTKPDPNNVDLTVIIDGPARETLKGKPGSKWLTTAFAREKMLEEFGVSPLRIVYWPVASVFRLERLQAHERDYFSWRGAWDDWWQRCRDDSQTGEPSLDTVHIRRGYLEVVP